MAGCTRREGWGLEVFAVGLEAKGLEGVGIAFGAI